MTSLIHQIIQKNRIVFKIDLPEKQANLHDGVLEHLLVQNNLEFLVKILENSNLQSEIRTGSFSET